MPFLTLSNADVGFYNIMITRPADHGLHVIQLREFNHHPAYTWLANFILKFYMSRPYLPCHRYELFFVLPHRYYNLISLILTWPSISTSFFWNRNPTHCMWAKQVVCFDSWLTRKNYLQTNAFLNLVVVEQKEHPHALWKATREVTTNKVVKETAG